MHSAKLQANLSLCISFSSPEDLISNKSYLPLKYEEHVNSFEFGNVTAECVHFEKCVSASRHVTTVHDCRKKYCSSVSVCGDLTLTSSVPLLSVQQLAAPRLQLDNGHCGAPATA